MSLTQARELRERRKKLCEDANAVLGSTEGTKQERNAKFDQMMKDADELKADIDRIERAEAALTEMRTGAPPNPQPGAGQGDDAEARRKNYAAAFRSYLLFGSKEEGGVVGRMPEEHRKLLLKPRSQGGGLVSTEYRDMGTGGGNALQGTGGGYFVPVGFVDEVESALKYYGPMLTGDGSGRDGLPTIMPTATGQPLPHPTDNDTAVTGEQIDENAQVNTNDVTISNVVFGAYKYSTKMVKVSIELLQDSAFDIEAYLKEKFAIRLGRILNTKFTTGSGTNTPQGIMVGATLGATAVGSSGNTGGAETGATSIGSDDMTALEHAVDILYRRGAKYMMNDTTVALLKKVKDKYGRPLWMPGVAVNAPDTINGYSYLANNDMDQVQLTPNSPPITAKSIVFGQLSKYTIRRVKELAVLRLEERFADFGQIAFVGFARYDGRLLDAGTHPVKYLQQLAE